MAPADRGVPAAVLSGRYPQRDYRSDSNGCAGSRRDEVLAREGRALTSREVDLHTKSTQWRVEQPHRGVMRSRYGLNDGKAQANPFDLPPAESVEAFEDALALVLRNAGPPIVDGQSDNAGSRRARDPYREIGRAHV